MCNLRPIFHDMVITEYALYLGLLYVVKGLAGFDQFQISISGISYKIEKFIPII